VRGIPGVHGPPQKLRLLDAEGGARHCWSLPWTLAPRGRGSAARGSRLEAGWWSTRGGGARGDSSVHRSGRAKRCHLPHPLASSCPDFCHHRSIPSNDHVARGPPPPFLSTTGTTTTYLSRWRRPFFPMHRKKAEVLMAGRSVRALTAWPRRPTLHRPVVQPWCPTSSHGQLAKIDRAPTQSGDGSFQVRCASASPARFFVSSLPVCVQIDSVGEGFHRFAAGRNSSAL
jgi:hypothetical protein